MKSKYYLVILLIGILPVLALTGVYFWTVLNQPPPPAARASRVNPSARLPQLKTQVETMASAMSNSIRSIFTDVPRLTAHNTEADLTTFRGTHNGVSGVAVLTLDGKVERMVPSTPPLLPPAYGSTEEFQKAASKTRENNGQPYLFFTQETGYPAFVFAISISPREIAEVVVGLSNFFRDVNPADGDMLFLEAQSGLVLYDTDASKEGEAFNPDQQPWRAGIQADVAGRQGGQVFNPGSDSAVYAYAGFGKFGIVHLLPPSVLGGAPAGRRTGTASESPADLILNPMSLAAILCLGWILIGGSLFWGMILAPLRRATAAVLNAANGSASLTPETVHRFGRDEAGQVVQAAAALMQKVEEEKQKAGQETAEAAKRSRAEVEAKTREAEGQVNAAQQMARTAQAELAEKGQLLADKLRELDALKGMSEGLRGQAEQAKADGARLKSQLATAESAQEDFKKRLAEAQGKLSEMESKLLTAMAASSTIQVSQVRAAAIRTMAEELKTTLGIIKGYVSSALGTTQGGINEKQQEFLGMVINRSARLEKFINDLLDIYQVEIEQAEAKPEEVNLASEIEGLAFNFQAQAEVKNIKIKVEAKPGLPKVPVVRRRFNQLWNILYLQTIKDAPRGSTLPIILEPVGDSVKVTLQDPGLNVAPESLPKLFDEFYDPKHTASPQLAGTGLKFALVKTILAAHGGGAFAEKGEPGTKLVLTFATHVKKPGDAPAPPAAAAPGLPAMAVRPVPTPLRPGVGIGTPLPTGAKPSVASPGPSASAAPSNPSLGAPPPPPPGMGLKPPVPFAGTPKSPVSPGVLDSLISKVPPVTAPGLRPTPGVSPAPGALPTPSPAVPPAGKPSLPFSPVPGVTAAPLPGAAPKPPSPAPPAVPLGAPPIPKPAVPPVTPVAGIGAPGPLKPPVPPPGGAPSIGLPKPAAPSVPGSAGPAIGISKPPSPGVPPAGAPAMPPKPVAPGLPNPAAPPVSGTPLSGGTPSLGGPPLPGGTLPVPGLRPPITPAPGMPPKGPGMAAPPVAPNVSIPSAPKVIPTSVKPTAPPPGILDLDNMDGMKLDAKVPNPTSAPGVKPPAPPPGAPPMPAPGAPKPPLGGMKPRMPGTPSLGGTPLPGGMPPIPGAGKPIVKDLTKEGDGDLIE